MRGYTDKLLHLNLSELKISKENIPESVKEDSHLLERLGKDGRYGT